MEKLTYKEDVGYVEKDNFAGRSFDSVIRLVLRSFQYFNYTYVACILVCLYPCLICLFLWFNEQRVIHNLVKHQRCSFL